MRTQHQKTFLTATVVALGAAALMGIVAVFADFGDTGWKVLATTLLVAAAGVLSLASATAAAHGRVVAGRVGMGAAWLALPISIVLLWVDDYAFSDAWGATWDWLAKAAATFFVFAVAAPHVGLLSLARLRRLEWVQGITYMAITVLAAISLAAIFEADIDDLSKVITVAAILATFGTISVPILHRMSRISGAGGLVTVAADAAIALTCPRCRSAEEMRAGKSACSSCGLGFSISLRENKCPCGYQLYGLAGNVCPECGRTIA